MTPAASLINFLIDRFSFESYLEIGCFQDATFDTVKAKEKVGVDPVSGGTHRMTSDLFFTNIVCSNQYHPDIVFVDGMHERKQVIRDVVRALGILNKKEENQGVVVVHDCLPRVRTNQLSPDEFREMYNEDPPAGRAWNGDVWRGVTDLRCCDWPDICTLDFDWGFGIVLNRLNSNQILLPPTKLDWETYERQRDELLNVVGTREEVIRFIEAGVE